MRRRAAVLIPGDGKRGMSLPSCGCFDEVLWVVHVEVPLNGRDLPSRGEESNFPRAENACGVLAAPQVRTLSPPIYQFLVLGMSGTLCGHYMRVLEERGMLRKPEKLGGPSRLAGVKIVFPDTPAVRNTVAQTLIRDQRSFPSDFLKT